jgi:hypothetical protein
MITKLQGDFRPDEFSCEELIKAQVIMWETLVKVLLMLSIFKNAIVLAAVTVITFGLMPPATQAQLNGGMGLGQQDLIRQVQQTAAFLRYYRLTHSQFPKQIPEIDDLLLNAYKTVGMSQPDSRIIPQSKSVFRTYYQFAYACDPTIRGIPIINGQSRLDKAWSGAWICDPNTIVILTDGANQFIVWATATNLKPIEDPNTGYPMVIHETVETKNGCCN